MVKYPTIWTILASILITGLVYWKLPLQGLIPFPGNLLTGRFFPWSSQSWNGYPTGVPYKEFISADTVRQTYPWRLEAIHQLKQGQFPWWNPYAFSGTPLFANLQTAALYPLNLLYLVFPDLTAWTIQVLLQPILAICFTYLFLTQLKLSPSAAFFGGLVFAFSGFMTVWLELNTVGHAGIWLPLILWSLTQSQKNPRYYWITFLGFTFSLLAGHIQTTLYCFLLSTFYFLHLHCFSLSFLTHLRHFVSVLACTTLVSSIQLIPAWQLFQQSSRTGSDPEIFNRFLLPPSHLVTLIIPNFFGNPATSNYTGSDYGEFMTYFGLIPLALAMVAMFYTHRSPPTRYFVTTLIIVFVLIIPNPIAQLPLFFKIPILSSSAPARALYLFQFSAAVLSAIGADQIFSKPSRLKRPVLVLLLTFSLISFYVLFSSFDPIHRLQSRISLRNMVIPGLNLILLLSIWIIVALRNSLSASIKRFLPVSLILVVTLDFSIFANKYLPFSEPEFTFPDSPIFSQLKHQTDHHRFFGDFTASVSSNTWIPYRIYGVEGYDSLYVSRYGQLLTAAANHAQLPSQLSRSDAVLPPNQDDFLRQRLQDLLGVKYLLDNTHDLYRFPTSRYTQIWQQESFTIYTNDQVLPRTFLVPTYTRLDSPQQILDQIFNPNWDPEKIIILEQLPVSHSSPFQKPPTADAVIQSELIATGSAHLLSYQPHLIEISVSTPKPQFLFLSDVYYPGWKAYVDHNLTPIYRANFTFRSIIVPAGNHLVVFSYQPSIQDFFTGSYDPDLAVITN